MTLYQINKKARENAQANGNPVSGQSDYNSWLNTISGYNQNRVPNMPNLESLSSDRISELLNPPEYFTDTSRQAAELGAMRGIGGSPAAGASAVRLTDQERLKRIQLGSELLSAAAGRYPTAAPPAAENFFITPAQQAQLNLNWSEIQNERNKLKSQLTSNQSGTNLASSRVPGFVNTYFNY